MALPSQAPRTLQAPLACNAPLNAPRDALESLLRARKLDRTLTTTLPERIDADKAAPFGVAALDVRLSGGLPRGQLSELIGPVSSGRTSLAWAWLGAATARGESVALVDTFDRFDPESGTRCGIDLSRLLWVRGQALTKTAGAIDPAWLPGARAVDGPGTLLERTIDRSLKSLNLVLQSGVCTAVVLDFADVPLAGIRRVPITTWLRLQRIVEDTDVACLVMGSMPLARSAGGITVRTGAPGAPGASGAAGAVRSVESERPRVERWVGAHDRSRRLAGLAVGVGVSSPRRLVQGRVSLETTTRHDRWAVE